VAPAILEELSWSDQEARMRTRSGFIGVVALAVLAAAAQGAAAARATSGSCSSGQVVKTKSYVFALSIGPVETMYTAAEVKAKHPKSGEEMLSGQMAAGMTGMTMPTTGQKHLEVHICTPAGAVVTGAHPKIVVSDPASNQMAVAVPIAVMEGVTQGDSDLHYGNNVSLAPGHEITVTVTLNGQQAVFHTTVPKPSR
jgi:hypothetical protein